MKIIIAPSKTMKYKDYGFISSKQLFPTQTQYLLSILKEYNDDFIILDVENSEIKIEKNKISSAKSLYDWNEK